MSIGSPNYRYGVRGVKIALQLAEGSYDTPWAERGVQSIGENASDSNTNTFYSEDTDSANVQGAPGAGTLNVQFSEFSDDYMRHCLGHHTDSVTGGIAKSSDDAKEIFAMGFEIQGTRRKTRVWKYGCTSSEPTATFQSNQGGTVTEAPQSCTVTVGGDNFDSGSYYELTCHEGDPGYATFLDSVPTPTVNG